MRLPIFEIETEFLDAYRNCSRIMLSAPTGSGKSTQIPQILINAGLQGSGEIVVLQPRRIAARALSRRVAWELGERLGNRVGYQIRSESLVSRDTVIRFVTEGILLRRFINDPELRGVSGILFDEFHERNLHGDIALARAVALQKTARPDLKIVVMSATLETEALSSYLSPCARIASEGRVFPVDISHIDERDARKGTPIWELAADQVTRSVTDRQRGHVLVFMPGAFEIGQTIKSLGRRLSSQEFKILPLHSELGAREQDAALDACDRRKVIVSTNVAETSLTIDDVRLVVDSGQARVARYDAARGLNTLWIEKISHASAKQRAGRAGRTGPGACVRLWSRRDHEQRAEFDEPDIQRVDLAESLLTLMVTGIDDLADFDWFERPCQARFEEAMRLLEMLGAVNRDGSITSEGRRMAEFPLHPRFGAMMLAADNRDCVEEAALAAAIAQRGSVYSRKVDKEVAKKRDAAFGDGVHSDLIAQIRACEEAETRRFDIAYCREYGLHSQTARQVSQISRQVLASGKYAGIATRQDKPAADESVVKCILSGFPDRVCRRLDRGTMRSEMVGKLRGVIARESLARQASLFVACDIVEIGNQTGGVATVFSLCSEVEVDWLRESYPEDFRAGTETRYDEKRKRVVQRSLVAFRDLEIESRENLDVPLDVAATELANLVESGKAKLDKWDARVESYLGKVAMLASCFPEYEIETLDADSRRLLVEQCCYGARSVRDLKKQEALPVVKSWFGPEIDRLVETETPDKLRLANGGMARMRYEASGAVLSAKIQELYDLDSDPVICSGRIQPKIEILAPNMRPVQLTDSLSEFWHSAYPAIKKELKGRYPKHEWR